MEDEALETSAEVAEAVDGAAAEMTDLDIDGIEDLLDGISGQLADGFAAFDDRYESLNTALAGLASINTFTLAVLLVILGVLLFVVLSVAVRRL